MGLLETILGETIHKVAEEFTRGLFETAEGPVKFVDVVRITTETTSLMDVEVFIFSKGSMHKGSSNVGLGGLEIQDG